MGKTITTKPYEPHYMPPLEEQLCRHLAQKLDLIVRVGDGQATIWGIKEGLASPFELQELMGIIEDTIAQIWDNYEDLRKEENLDEKEEKKGDFRYSKIGTTVFQISQKQYKQRSSDLGYTTRMVNQVIEAILRRLEIHRDRSLWDTATTRYMTPDGVLDLQEKRIVPARPDEVYTRRVNARFVEGIEITSPEFAPFWNFIIESTQYGDQPDPKYAESLLSILGYLVLIPYNPLKLITILSGPTNSGKSTLANVLNAIFPGLIGSLDPSSLTISSLTSSDKRPDLIQVAEKNLAITTEADSSMVFATALLKRLSGNDLITNRRLYENSVTYKFSAKLILATNSVPAFDAVDSAFVKRILTLEFPNTVPDSKLNLNLENELLVESSRNAIFTILAKNAMNYLEKGEI